MPNRKHRKYLSDYKVINSSEWVYKSLDGSYTTEFFIIEDKIIFESAFGKPNLKDTKAALKIVVELISEHFTLFKPHYISDSRKIKGADQEVRRYVAEFHKNNPIFESVSLIASTFTKALFSIVKNIGIGDFKNWKVYRNEQYCIDEILQGEFIIGQSLSRNLEYELIYQALADISTNVFSYEELIEKTESNEELRSVIQAIQLIDEENRFRDNQLDLSGEIRNSNIQSTSILFKSILENTDTLVALMDEENNVINVNRNFSDFFETQSFSSKKLDDFLVIGETNYSLLDIEKYSQFISKYQLKTLSCKLYKIENLDGNTYVIFMGEDISEKEVLKASQEKLLNELQQQNFKLLRANHLLSHEINHQIASLSQILNEFKTSDIGDSNVGKMITKVQSDLNASLKDMNQTLFESDYTDLFDESNPKIIEQKKSLKVLLIDDDEITNLLNDKILKNNLVDCQLTVEVNAKKALELIKSNTYLPDIIILDLYMRMMDGFDFLECYKHLKLVKKPMIFVVSSSRDPKEIARAKSYDDVKTYYSKPLSNDKVKGILKSFYS